MHNLTLVPKRAVWLAAALLFTACSQPGSDTRPATAEPAPAAKAPVPVEIKAPAGRYELDLNHANLQFRISHLGFSNYVVRFADFDATIDLVPDDLAASSVVITVDPTSVRTDYAGDYKATHEDSPFSSWNEDLAQSEKFFHAGEYPEIRFESTQVSAMRDGRIKVVGDLTLRGQTHPVTLTASVVGSAAQHPMAGVGVIGFSASGEFKRSTFGMDHLLDPPLVGDTVTVEFDGEFIQAASEG